MDRVEKALRDYYMSEKKVGELRKMLDLVVHNYKVNKKGYFFPYNDERLERLERIGLVMPFNDGSFNDPRTYWKPTFEVK